MEAKLTQLKPETDFSALCPWLQLSPPSPSRLHPFFFSPLGAPPWSLDAPKRAEVMLKSSR